MPPLNCNRETWLAERVKELESELAVFKGKDGSVQLHQSHLLTQVNEMGPRLDQLERENDELKQKLSEKHKNEKIPSTEYYNSGLSTHEND